MLSEREFARKCAEGDRECRDEFVRRYSRLIRKYIASAARLRGVPPEAHAEDIFQEFVCGLFEGGGRKLLSFQGRNGCSFASWLRQITLRFALRYLSRARISLSLDDYDDEQRLVSSADDGEEAGIVSELLAGERMHGLKECIEVLDDDARFFIEMHINRGVRLEDLRGPLGFSRSAVDVYKSRLIGRLRECFRKKGFFLE